MKFDAIVIDEIRPATPTGFAPKSSVGESTPVHARIFRDGHGILAARVRWRLDGRRTWESAPLGLVGNDHWTGSLTVAELGRYQFVIEAWTDHFATWRHEIRLKVGAGQDVAVELEEGARLLEGLVDAVAAEDRDRIGSVIATVRSELCSQDVKLNASLDDALVPMVEGIARSDDLTSTPVQDLWVDRPLAAAGAWYEFFPRSEGGFIGSIDRLPAVAAMGFDIVYFPPIHPVGVTARKGPNNTLTPSPTDLGSPWAIGSADGGHTGINPDLGTPADFRQLVAAARDLGLAVALDYALQCSPDHPWVTEHPEWFHHRPDGSIKYAENPPKKYQDIYPLNFWPAADDDRVALWSACRDILLHWIGEGVEIFRVDNPHTKPVAFWHWCIHEIHAEHPEVLFLAEAFTTPAMMAKLAEVGFSQGYTYFTWRTGRDELVEYVQELSHGPLADFMRPNFWPATPDILSGPLRNGNRAAFLIRYVLAATLVPVHGMYSGYELLENQPANASNEEFLDSEKYQIRKRDWDRPDSIAPFITDVNAIRRRHRSFGALRSICFHHCENDNVLAYSRGHRDSGDLVLVIVNLDSAEAQQATVHLDLASMGLSAWEPFVVFDELTAATYEWHGSANYVRLDPRVDQVAHIFSIQS